MRRRAPGPALALALTLTVSCTTSSGSDLPTTASVEPPVSASPVTTTTVDMALAEALPRDPEVKVGVLDNGLTYYLKENDSPGGRAELRLVVDAGSVQEDPDQSGTAHFLEHMMFNGTERFPKNELIAILEGFGPRFGPDINAYTSFDETVYELSLTTDSDELVELGVDVLREWATRATLTEVDVVGERGVILDEWRLRAQGYSARVGERLQELILPGSAYEGHLPIGNADSISGTSPAVVRRFYQDWYHPSRMAVVAVGDFDLRDMEARIVEAFGDIGASEDPRPFQPVSYVSPAQPRARTYTDEEATGVGLSVLWPTPLESPDTLGGYRDRVAVSLGLEILGDRLVDDALSGAGPLLGASVVDLAWTRAISLRGVEADIRGGAANAGVEHLFAEVERMRRDGVSDREYERALAGFAAATRQMLDQQESVQDAQIADEIVAYHLSGQPLLSPKQRFEVANTAIEGLTKEDIASATSALLRGAPSLVVIGPDDEEVALPDETALLEIWASLPTITLEPRDVFEPDDLHLMEPPAPVEAIETTVDPSSNTTTIRYANGATVYLRPSQISRRGVYGVVEGFGGTSRVDVEDLPELFLATQIVARSGIGVVDVPTLRRLLADRIVSVEPWISETRQGIEAGSSTQDTETMLQMIHLTMTSPRFDQAAVEAVIDETTSLLAAREDLPGVLFEEALNESYYGDDPRYFVLPSVDQLAEFDVAAAEDAFVGRYSNAADFAFVFVGDFDTAEMSDLAARYIGTLPGDAQPSGYVDHQPLPPRRVQVSDVEAGVGEQGQVAMFFTNEFTPTARDRVVARVVELILTSRLRQRVREELSATYSISAGVDLQRDPDPFAEAFVISTGDPVVLDVISEEIIADISELQAQGPTEAEFATAVEQMRDELELLDNGQLATALVTAHLYPDQPFSDLRGRSVLLDGLTPADVANLTRVVFDLGQRIEVRQVPRG